MSTLHIENFTVRSYDVNSIKNIKLNAIMNFFQEVAGNHAFKLDVGHDKMEGVGLVWVLSRLKFELDKLPVWNQEIVVETWPKGIDRLFARRDCQYKSLNGEVLLRGTSGWLLVDLTKRRPVKIESIDVKIPYEPNKHALDDSLDKIKLFDNIVFTYDRNVSVNEIDMNKHVNNTKYMEWVLDCFDLEFLEEKIPTMFQINFSSETKYGEQIRITKSVDEMGSTFALTGTSITRNTEVFQSLITFK